jgi:hypothetical protein
LITARAVWHRNRHRTVLPVFECVFFLFLFHSFRISLKPVGFRQSHFINSRGQKSLNSRRL